MFFINSIALGAGLAMDAFSVSLANGLNEPEMNRPRRILIAGTYAVFQCAMPLIGWICVRTVAEYFEAFRVAIPWIALILLAFIGGKMLLEGIKDKIQQTNCEKCKDRDCDGCRNKKEETVVRLGFMTLMLQGVATSIDALSVGFTISDYVFGMALLACLIIAAVTFIICIAGLRIGARAGTALGWKASVLGGVILIAIGVEIFVTNIM